MMSNEHLSHFCSSSIPGVNYFHCELSIPKYSIKVLETLHRSLRVYPRWVSTPWSNMGCHRPKTLHGGFGKHFIVFLSKLHATFSFANLFYYLVLYMQSVLIDYLRSLVDTLVMPVCARCAQGRGREQHLLGRLRVWRGRGRRGQRRRLPAGSYTAVNN